MKRENDAFTAGEEGGVGSVRKLLGAEKRGQRGLTRGGSRRDEKMASRAAKRRRTVNELHYYTRQKRDERRRYRSGEGDT